VIESTVESSVVPKRKQVRAYKPVEKIPFISTEDRIAINERRCRLNITLVLLADSLGIKWTRLRDAMSGKIPIKIDFARDINLTIDYLERNDFLIVNMRPGLIQNFLEARRNMILESTNET